jgi:diguanylate cyclase
MRSRTNSVVANNVRATSTDVRIEPVLVNRLSVSEDTVNQLMRDHARTISIAEIAIGQIKALGVPADPPSFELWYNYASNQNPALNQSINEKLARKKSLSNADLDQIYEQYFTPMRFGDAVDNVGNKINNEVGQIAALLRAAINSTTQNQRHFEAIGQKLKGQIDHISLRSIVESLILTTKTAEKENNALEEKLKASQYEIEELRQNLNVVRIESLTDQLTQLANRKYFDRAITNAIDDAELKPEPFSLLMCDVDHFKKFNDTFGHQVGDQVLRLVAHILKQSIKGQDTAARYGGEEFAILLPSTGLSGAKALGEAVRKAVMSKELEKRSTGEKLGRVTISIGVAQFLGHESSETLIERADKCLYAAKKNGRNRVVTELELDSSVPAIADWSV